MKKTTNDLYVLSAKLNIEHQIHDNLLTQWEGDCIMELSPSTGSFHKTDKEIYKFPGA